MGASFENKEQQETTNAKNSSTAPAKAEKELREAASERAMATGGDIVPNVHGNNNSSNKTLLKSEALYKYILDTTVLPREPECMRELRLLTDKHEQCYLATSPDVAQLLRMLIKITGAKNTIEVGVFTGHSLLATALALPDDGKVVAIDVTREYFDLGLPIIQKAGLAHKVDFREGAGLAMLQELLTEEGNEARFDFAFVDADKSNYVRYHELLLRLVRVGGTIVYDDTLWCGKVALPPDAPMSDLDRQRSAEMRDHNAKVAADPRVEVCQLGIDDGVTICCRLA